MAPRVHRSDLITGIVIFAHGSRVESANEAVRVFARAIAGRGAAAEVEPAFLELGEPDLKAAVASLVSRGVKLILVIPYFLTLGMHLQRDLPALVESAASLYPGVEFRVTPPLDGHPALAQVVLDRAADALAGWL